MANIDSLLKFMDNSPCNFLAVKTIKEILLQNGYFEKSLKDKLDAKPGEKFFVTKNDSAIFAFKIGHKPVTETGFRIVAAHSDSPCFRIKPHAEMCSEGGIVRLNTEVYGGPILYTWFDRPLSIAGRVILKGENALEPLTTTVKIDRPLLSISHLAIHFNRAVNEGNKLSKQKDMLPIIAKVNEKLEADNMLLKLVAQELKVNIEDILDFDLMLYDTEKACTFGLNNEFVSCGRLDDLSMAHAAITALVESTGDDATCIAAIFDNEETGSGTKQGAGSPVLANVMRRIVEAQCGSFDDFSRAVARSFMISADNAHAFHPNYAEKYDPTNHPHLGGGPCIKINANCKYMSDAHSAAIFKSLCIEAGSPYQYFVNHSDVAGGSTLGNILTSQMDIEGVDVGNPLLAMHSVRETASVDDHINMTKVMTLFFNK
ncbi:M18 family aminopeptidase [Sodaliphilus sp.]|uniref:M18 family aminopeptidase n=1 Tax=Sodaliphilus sp. TaxID=2815818 RepID=UPI00388D28F0